MTQETANKIFDSQIITDKKFIIHKKLFNLTFNFSMKDWKLIRTEEYWKVRDNLPVDDRKKYTLTCVEKYLNK